MQGVGKMQKIDRAKVLYMVFAILLATLFVFKDSLIPRPLPEATVTLSSEAKDVELSEEKSIESESEQPTEPGGLVIRAPQFQKEIEDAYTHEATIEWARDFIRLFYETNEHSLNMDTYTPYVSETLAQAILKEKEQQLAAKIERQHTNIAFQILSLQPFKLLFEVQGKRNGQNEQIIYEVLLNDSFDQIISVVQVASP